MLLWFTSFLVLTKWDDTRPGSNIIHVLDASIPGDIIELHHVTLGNVDVTDVEFCGSYIFTSYDDLIDKENGVVVIYEKYNRENDTLREVARQVVGSLPDMLKPNLDCSVILVAIEGEGYVINETLVDPYGGVGIIEFNVNDATVTSYTMADFRNFSYQDYTARGVRFVYRENNNSFAQDIEPEYLTYNEDYTLGYVVLQENNAIAVVDISKKEVTEIYGLGVKNWKTSGLDASDRDNEINIQPWDIYGMYQPDAIDHISFGNEEFLLTANEGEAKEIEGIWEEEIRGKDIITGNLAGNLDSELLTALGDDTKLGRLKFSKVEGVNETTGKFDKLYAYGGRSFTIWRASDMSLVYDSGNEVERRLADLYPYVFNSNGVSGSTPVETKDSRSDDKGPECEGITHGIINNKIVIFVGNERSSVIALFSFSADIAEITFESMYSGVQNLDTNKTWDEIYDERATGDIDPEDLQFISASDSPTGEPLLLVAGTASGSVSLYAIKDTDHPVNPTTIMPDTGAASSTKYEVFCLLPAVVFGIVQTIM